MTGTHEHLTVPLYKLAHCRTGDKGDISNISVIAWDSTCYLILKSELTEEKVFNWFCDYKPKYVIRYELPELEAFNFVIDGVLNGGVNNSLNLDAHGKSLSFHLLEIPIMIPRRLQEQFHATAQS